MRKLNKQNVRCSIAVIVDGQDEKWYIEQVKENYLCGKSRQAKILPNLPEKKTIDELFKEAENKAAIYDYVILIIDLDEPLQSNHESELKKFKEWYNKYRAIKTNQSVRGCKWMERLVLIINNPCLEFWYLLHAYKTTKFYSCFEDLKKDLIKIHHLEDYEKSANYYNKSQNNIYKRLNSIDNNNGLSNARKNAKPFCIESCRQEGVSEMNLLFDFFDNQL